MEAQLCRRSLATQIISLSSQSSSAFRIVCGPSNTSSGPFSAQARCASCLCPRCICGPVSDCCRLRAFTDLRDCLEQLTTLAIGAVSPRRSHRVLEPQSIASHTTLKAGELNAIEISDFSSHRFKPWCFYSHRAFSQLDRARLWHHWSRFYYFSFTSHVLPNCSSAAPEVLQANFSDDLHYFLRNLLHGSNRPPIGLPLGFVLFDRGLFCLGASPCGGQALFECPMIG